jgi:hypothetical protein
MECRDTIIVTGFEIENPFVFYKRYFADYSKLYFPYQYGTRQREFLTSDLNGKMPAYFSMRSRGEPLYLAHLSCSAPFIKQPGRGFRVHVIESGLTIFVGFILSAI